MSKIIKSVKLIKDIPGQAHEHMMSDAVSESDRKKFLLIID